MDKQKQVEEILIRGVENIYPNKEALEKKLQSGQKMKLYCGYDPSAPTLHIGHAITLRKLAQFQKLGHEVIMLLGDFTGMIGDPDKMEARKKLTREEVLKNAKNYQELASKILDFSSSNPVKIMYNSKWNDKLTFIELIEIASHFTVQQMIVRDMFQKRLEKKKPIYLHEFLYPLTQAYDSVVMDVDLEVGGNDQIFNMLCGRDLFKAVKGKEKLVLSVKLLTDSSGDKMGKTTGNMVTLDEKPKEMFGQVMSWTDGMIVSGLELCTDMPMNEINQIEEQMKDGDLNPRDAKARLAKEIISIHHSKKDALEAEKEFNRVFKEKKQPSKMKEISLSVSKTNTSSIPQILTGLHENDVISSIGEGRRLVEQGAVKIDGKKVKDPKKEVELKNSSIVQVGKRRFVKINAKKKR